MSTRSRGNVHKLDALEEGKAKSFVDVQLGNDNSEAVTSISSADLDVPNASPDGGYGWVCVVSTFLITTNTWGINGSYGVYLAYYHESEIFTGTEPLAYAFIGGLGISQITFPAPVVTAFSRRFGLKLCLLLGAALQTTALVTASFAKEIWHLALSQGVLFGWGTSFLYVGSYSIVPQWFTKKRSLATSIGASGGGIGGLIWSLAAGAMISKLGISWSFRITAVVAFIFNSTAALFTKENKRVEVHQKAFDLQLLKRYELLLLVAWGFFSMLAYTIVLFAISDYAISIELSHGQSALIAAMANLGMGLARPIIGLLSDRFGRINVACCATLIGALTCFCIWIFAKSYAVLILFAVLSGSTVIGTFWATVGPVAADVLGLQELPSVLSIIWTAMSFPTLFAAAIALGLEINGRGGYLDVQIFCGAVMIGGTICMLLLRGRRVSTVAAAEANFSSSKGVEALEADCLQTARMTLWIDMKNMTKWKKV